jgi:hypothetical protein
MQNVTSVLPKNKVRWSVRHMGAESKNFTDARIAALLVVVRRAATNDMLDRVHAVVEQEMKTVSTGIKELGRDSESLDDELDLIEDLLGLAFVVAQTSITHFRTRLEMLSQACNESGIPLSFGTGKKELFKLGKPINAALPMTPIEAINAVANYWKHAEKWVIAESTKDNKLVWTWDTGVKKPEKETVDIVTAMGIRPSSTGNLRIAAKVIGITDFNNLSPMREKLRNWAASLYETARAEIAQQTMLKGNTG